MPSHKIHLAIAKKVNDKLKFDLDLIMLGSVLPDLAEEKNHQISHFQQIAKGSKGLANPFEFVEKYNDKLDNPVLVGFLIHLLTDRFYNEYFYKHFYIYDKDSNGIGIYLKGKKVLLNEDDRKRLKHREFDLYDKWLLNHNFVPKFKNIDCINKVIDIDEAHYNKDKLKEYIILANNDVDKVNFFSKKYIYNYKITNKKELDKIFNECVKYTDEYLKNLKIIKDK